MRYRVISEYVDLKTGERVQPGSLVSFEEPERAERLVAAGCLVPVGEKQAGKKQIPPSGKEQPAGDNGAQAPAGEEQQGVSGGEDGNQVGSDGTGTANTGAGEPH